MNAPNFAFIPASLAQFAFAFYMAGIMAFLMSCCLVALNTGFEQGYFGRVLRSYLVAFPVAFLCVIFVRPLVVKLVALTVKAPSQQ